MFDKAQKNELLPIYGNGTNIRDWIFVRDHCLGILAAIKNGKPGEIYNFGGNAERTNLEIVREILAFCRASESLITFITDRPGHDLRYAMDCKKAQKELGWQAQTNFPNGLKETLNWYKNNQNWLKSVKNGDYLAFTQKWYNNKKNI